MLSILCPSSTRKTWTLRVAEHLVVEIGSTVTMQIVQVVPDRGTAGAGQVNIGKQDFLLVRRGYSANRPAIGAGNQRAAQVASPSLFADSAGGGNKHIVYMGGGHRQIRSHALAGVVEQWRGRPVPVVQTANDVCTLLTEDSRHLREPDVPADQQANAAYWRFKNREAQIS